MHDAKTNLSRLVDALKTGAESEVVIAIGNKPAARLVPFIKTRRALGIDDGLFEIPADFDEASPEVETLFNG
ncbi:MAG: hypothetical protein NVSMB31_06890 [Vulcanimicrobiaceae bacterium]